MIPAARVKPDLVTAKVKARSRRRSFPIHAYCGPNGGGKSLAAVFDTLPSLAAGRPVVSTVRILDPYTLQPHPLWVPLTDYATMLEAEFCDMILDEVTGVASSRDSAGMPSVISNRIVQLRRQDCTVRWTAPSWKRADTIIRECTQAVTICVGFMPAKAPAKDGLDRLWSSKRAFYWRTYDAQTFDEWSAHRKEKLRPVARQVMWRPGSVAERAYDTFDAVMSLGHVSEAGTCMDCGGHRAKPKCSCAPRDPYAVTPPAAPARGRRVLIAETDDTPSVVVETPLAS